MTSTYPFGHLTCWGSYTSTTTGRPSASSLTSPDGRRSSSAASVYSYVIDFILVHYKDVWSYPAFNIADSAICVGAAMLVIDALFDRKHPEKGGSAGKPDGAKPADGSPKDSAGKGGEA